MEEKAELRLLLYKDTVSVYIGELGERVICENTLGKTKEISLPLSSNGWEVLGTDDEYIYLAEKGEY